MMPSCDQTGVPIHFHSSTTSASASLMSWRIRLRVFPRQSPSSAILFEMSSDADWPWLAPDLIPHAAPPLATVLHEIQGAIGRHDVEQELVEVREGCVPGQRRHHFR